MRIHYDTVEAFNRIVPGGTKPVSKKLLNNLNSSKKLSEDDVVQMCMWAYFGAGGSIKSNRAKDFTHCGAGIECALREAYYHGRDSVKGT